MPDFSLCGPAAGDLMPTAMEAWEYFTSSAWTDATTTGGQAWKQDACYACWYNPPLLVGLCCVPCCMCVTDFRNAAKMNGKTCESNCLSACVLGACCCLNTCYLAKKRTEFRKKYDLEGAPLYDCLLICCTTCYVCQDANQLMDIGGYNVPNCSIHNVDGYVATNQPKEGVEAKAKEEVKETKANEGVKEEVVEEEVVDMGASKTTPSE
jgi:Cys-rich protein (TIGR01571 family)